VLFAFFGTDPRRADEVTVVQNLHFRQCFTDRQVSWPRRIQIRT
jgi:hypothetical protein